MPRATVSSEAVRVELKSLEGAHITVRQLAHGQRLHRSDISARLSFEQQQTTRSRNGLKSDARADDTPQRTEIELMQLHARQYEYVHMITEHNLEEENGQPMNFHDITTFDRLAPHIGEEIDEILDDANANKLDKEAFRKPSAPASTSAPTS